MKTSRFANKGINNELHVPLQISLSKPKFPLNYDIKAAVHILAPTREILAINNEDEYFQQYIRRLDKFGVNQISKVLGFFARKGKEIVLLCFEDVRNEKQWCHRRMFAQWWEEQTGERVDELYEPPLIVKEREPAPQQRFLF